MDKANEDNLNNFKEVRNELNKKNEEMNKKLESSKEEINKNLATQTEKLTKNCQELENK